MQTRTKQNKFTLSNVLPTAQGPTFIFFKTAAFNTNVSNFHITALNKYMVVKNLERVAWCLAMHRM